MEKLEETWKNEIFSCCQYAFQNFKWFWIVLWEDSILLTLTIILEVWEYFS